MPIGLDLTIISLLKKRNRKSTVSRYTTEDYIIVFSVRSLKKTIHWHVMYTIM